MPLRDDRGTIIGTFGISRDITARKEAEQSLRSAEQRWRALLANCQELVMLVDSDGVFVYASPSVQRWLGYSPDELLGTPLVALSHEQDADRFAAAFGRVRDQSTEVKEPVTVCHRVRHKDGSWHSLESTFVSLKDDPAIQAVLVDSRDVTERVALEQERELGSNWSGACRSGSRPWVSWRRDRARDQHPDAVRRRLRHVPARRDRRAADRDGHCTTSCSTIDEPIGREERMQRMAIAEQEADLEYLRERIPAAITRTVDGIARVTSIVQAMKRFSHPSGYGADALRPERGDRDDAGGLPQRIQVRRRCRARRSERCRA